MYLLLIVSIVQSQGLASSALTSVHILSRSDASPMSVDRIIFAASVGKEANPILIKKQLRDAIFRYDGHS